MTPQISSRRSLLGAGVLGAALAVVASRTVSASVPPSTTTTTPPPQQPTEADTTLLTAAMALELTARDLYDTAIAAGAEPSVLLVMSEHHAAYAQAIAGMIGRSASTRVDSVYDDNEAAFASSDTAAVLAAGYDLESAAVATHTELLGVIEAVDAAKLIASIIAVESQHCVVLADAAGNGDDLDALLTNTATAIPLEELS